MAIENLAPEPPMWRPGKRWSRNPHNQSAALTEKFDIPIFLLLDDFKYLRTSQITACTGRSIGTIRRRMRKLGDLGYVTWIYPKLEHPYKKNPESIFANTTKAARIIAKIRDKALYQVAHIDPSKTQSNPYLTHQMLVADFLVRVKLACDQSQNEIHFIPPSQILAKADWRDIRQRPFLLEAPIRIGGMWIRKRIKCDRPFALKFYDPRSQILKVKPILTEIDCGTEVQGNEDTNPERSSIYYKYKVYRSLQETGAYKAQLGTDNFRVVFLTNRSQARADNARSCTLPIMPQGTEQWLFGAKDEIFSHPNILSAPWLTGKGSHSTLIG